MSELDVDQAESLLSQTEATIPVLEISLRTANNQLCVLMGRPMINLEPQIGPANIPTAPKEVAVGIPADLLRRRPDVRRAERLAAGPGGADRRGGVRLVSPYFDSWNARLSGPGFPTPVQRPRDSGRRRAELPVERAQLWPHPEQRPATDALFQQLVVDYQNTVLVAQQETENGLITFVKSQEQAKDLLESVVAAQKAVVIALAQYKAGMIDFNRVSLLEQNLVTYQNLQAQARGSIALGLIQTYRALGGGWTSRLDPNLQNTPGLGKRRGTTTGRARTDSDARPGAAARSAASAASRSSRRNRRCAPSRPRRPTHAVSTFMPTPVPVAKSTAPPAADNAADADIAGVEVHAIAEQRPECCRLDRSKRRSLCHRPPGPASPFAGQPAGGDARPGDRNSTAADGIAVWCGRSPRRHRGRVERLPSPPPPYVVPPRPPVLPTPPPEQDVPLDVSHAPRSTTVAHAGK